MTIVLPEDDPCSFCEYLAGRRPYTILERDDKVATLITRQQRGRLHALVIPVAHRPTVLDLQPSEYQQLMATVVRASRAITATVDAEGIAIWQKNGVADGQTVPHVHFHVAATVAGGGTEWGPVPTLAVHETDSLARQLRPQWDAAR